MFKKGQPALCKLMKRDTSLIHFPRTLPTPSSTKTSLDDDYETSNNSICCSTIRPTNIAMLRESSVSSSSSHSFYSVFTEDDCDINEADISELLRRLHELE